MAKLLAQAGTTVLGIILAATPVALWVAWTPALLIGVLLSAAGCAVLLVLMHEHLPHSAAPLDGALPALPEREIPAAIAEELHGVFPLIYHHSGRRNSRFRRAMRRISRLIENPVPGDRPR